MLNLRLDDEVHTVDADGSALCGIGLMSACTPEATSDPLNCWECISLVS